MTRRDWIVPGVLFAIAAGLFGLAWWLGRIADDLRQPEGVTAIGLRTPHRGRR